MIGYGSDVYTLGAILYQVLSGAPPFAGGSAKTVMNQVKKDRPARLMPFRAADEKEDSDSKIPERLVAICEAAMQRELSQRTASAEILASEIKTWLEGAEKRDKGLKEVEAAQQLADQAQAQERKAAQLWRQANARLEEDGAASEAGWALWVESRDADADARRLRRRNIRCLQGALVHAPELEEAHHALAELRLVQLIEAAAVGDRKAREILGQQFSANLEALSASDREGLEARLAAGLGDVISGQRLRRGVIVGRHASREAVGDTMRKGAQLVTLLGTAGVGKTRLALELAEDLRSGVSRTFFCDLTEAADTMGVIRRLARTLDVRLRDADPVVHLQEILGAEPTLLVLDNLEQVAEAVGPLIQEWVSKDEDLQVLATSRVRLGVPAETVVSIQPLSLLESVDLFVRRGHAVDRHFELSPDNRDQLCALVQKLDGLPLAIELAAARLNIFSLDQISERLNERFSLLRSRGRDAKALEGALDWSWGLLEPWAKAALSQASLFRGGFNLVAAEGVIEVGKDRGAPAMFDILGELVDNSLLRRDQGEAGGVRYRLLESIRVYANEKLSGPGKKASDLRGPRGLAASSAAACGPLLSTGDPRVPACTRQLRQRRSLGSALQRARQPGRGHRPWHGQDRSPVLPGGAQGPWHEGAGFSGCGHCHPGVGDARPGPQGADVAGDRAQQVPADQRSHARGPGDGREYGESVGGGGSADGGGGGDCPHRETARPGGRGTRVGIGGGDGLV